MRVDRLDETFKSTLYIRALLITGKKIIKNNIIIRITHIIISLKGHTYFFAK